jgi:crotonobetainyl-CoA:carnitine CoA-transferase CaiB-like acyl-CoA transferase
MRPFRPDAKCPLEGVRVLDLSRLVAGNMLSLQLADFGAEVIKIEDPRKGDPLRDWRVEGVSVHWKVYARNKKSVTLNLRDAQGLALLRRLATTAQVFIENFRPGTLEEMGIGPDVLHAANPKLIIVRVSGWGQDGPYRDKPGFGSLVEGMSGFAAKNGFADRPPVLPPLALADMVAGLYGSNAVLIALRAIEQRGGAGQVIDLPLLDPIFSVLGPEAAIYRLTQRIEPRVGSRSHNTAPRNVYETRDGRFISISASIQTMAERLFRAIGRADMIDDPRFRTNADRVRNIDECERPLAEFIKARTLAEALAAFEAAEVTAAPVYDIGQFIADPHVQARAIVTELPDDQMGAVPMHAVVPRLSGTPGEIRTPAPALGQHNDEILGGIGLSGDAIDDLRKRKVI